MSQHPIPPGQPPWTEFDEYLWHTCDIIADLIQGRIAQRPLVATPAPLPAGDRPLVTGPVWPARWRALGDGSYHHSQMMAMGSTSFVIGSMLGNAAGNAARRREATRNAQPRWVPGDPGMVTVSKLGAFVIHPTSHSDSIMLYWSGLDSVDLVAPDIFQTQYVSTTQVPVTMRLATPWASLIFALAAYHRFPHHPRILTRGWLPPGEEDEMRFDENEPQSVREERFTAERARRGESRRTARLDSGGAHIGAAVVAALLALLGWNHQTVALCVLGGIFLLWFSAALAWAYADKDRGRHALQCAYNLTFGWGNGF
ncbi:hypothetical protein [Streptomyces hydrogenans]|uniref:hypothetical protein n=1 Tax=Streptomyces hydrogenans TaxID=1873719 RepID=UPI0035D6567F